MTELNGSSPEFQTTLDRETQNLRSMQQDLQRVQTVTRNVSNLMQACRDAPNEAAAQIVPGLLQSAVSLASGMGLFAETAGAVAVGAAFVGDMFSVVFDFFEEAFRDRSLENAMGAMNDSQLGLGLHCAFTRLSDNFCSMQAMETGTPRAQPTPDSGVCLADMDFSGQVILQTQLQSIIERLQIGVGEENSAAADSALDEPLVGAGSVTQRVTALRNYVRHVRDHAAERLSQLANISQPSPRQREERTSLSTQLSQLNGIRDKVDNIQEALRLRNAQRTRHLDGVVRGDPGATQAMAQATTEFQQTVRGLGFESLRQDISQVVALQHRIVRAEMAALPVSPEREQALQFLAARDMDLIRGEIAFTASQSPGRQTADQLLVPEERAEARAMGRNIIRQSMESISSYLADYLERRLEQHASDLQSRCPQLGGPDPSASCREDYSSTTTQMQLHCRNALILPNIPQEIARICTDPRFRLRAWPPSPGRPGPAGDRASDTAGCLALSNPGFTCLMAAPYEARRCYSYNWLQSRSSSQRQQQILSGDAPP